MSVSSRKASRHHAKDDAIALHGRSSRAERGLFRAPSSMDLRRKGELAVLGARAAHLHAYRAGRSRFLPPSLLGEPGWDLLLFLFAATIRGDTVGTTKACAASGAPVATALRWISRLSDSGLIETLTSPEDQRLRNLRLTTKGIMTIAEVLDDAGSDRTSV